MTNNAQLHGCSLEGWECFHCGEVFTTVGEARDHFGATPSATPGCMLKVQFGDERGLLMALRKAEQTIAELRQDIEHETTLRSFHAHALKCELQSYKAFAECKTIADVFCLFDSVEGRAIAAEEKLLEGKGHGWAL